MGLIGLGVLDFINYARKVLWLNRLTKVLIGEGVYMPQVS